MKMLMRGLMLGALIGLLVGYLLAERKQERDRLAAEEAFWNNPDIKGHMAYRERMLFAERLLNNQE